MTTLRETIETFERLIGERTEAVAIGQALHLGMHGHRDVSKALLREEAMRQPEVDVEYDPAMGSIDPPHAIYAWTKSWVMFLAGDDGGAAATWLPRDPRECRVLAGGIDEWR